MRWFLLAAGALALAACSGSPAPTTADAPPPAKAASSHRPTPLDAMLKAEDKARNVENVLQKAAQDRRKTIDAASE